MNEKVQNYIDKKKEWQRKVYQNEKIETLRRLKLGEFEEKPKGAKIEDYPFIERINGKKVYCRFIPVEITDEEYEELKKYIPAPVKKVPTKNGWSSFAVIITIISALVMVFGTEDSSGIVFMIGAGIFGYMLFCMLPIIDLLSTIEKNQREKD